MFPRWHQRQADYGGKVLEPGTKVVTGAWDAVSLGLALMFGTAGLPHILMRFYMPDATQARKLVVWATIWIGGFYLITFILGFGAMVLVGQKGILAAGGGGNMAGPLLAKALGGPALFGFICAVAFATILAVVAGLTLSGAAALSHDFWVSTVKGGHASEEKQLKVARIASVILGICAILLGIAFQGQNVAYMVGLTFSIAASANFPALMLAIFWKRLTTEDAVCSIIFGAIGTLVLIYLGPTIQLDLLKNTDAPNQWWYFPESVPVHHDRRVPDRHRRLPPEAGAHLRRRLRGDGASRHAGHDREGSAGRVIGKACRGLAAADECVMRSEDAAALDSRRRLFTLIRPAPTSDTSVRNAIAPPCK
jgi:Na+(H+)/acetate symporter ActP